MTTNDLSRRAFLTGVSAAACAAALPWPAVKSAALAPHFNTVILPTWLQAMIQYEAGMTGAISGIPAALVGNDVIAAGIRYQGVRFIDA